MCHGAAVGEIDDQEIDKLILHFDILGPWKAALRGEQDRLPGVRQVLASAHAVTCLTLWVRPEVLALRLARRQAKRGAKYRDRMEALMPVYEDHQALVSHYESWLELVSPYGFKEHWLVDCNQPEIKVYPLEAWKSLKATVLS